MISADSLLDLDAISDPLEREATVGIIHNCKQFQCDWGLY